MGRALYVLYGVKYIDPVSLVLFPGEPWRLRAPHGSGLASDLSLETLSVVWVKYIDPIALMMHAPHGTARVWQVT